jgi:adenine/guanine phosphoribosyltransferase-like PRPP-binding protein
VAKRGIPMSYIGSITNNRIRRRIILLAVKEIRASGAEFDAIACTGLSGLLIAPEVARILGKTLIVVRKSDDVHNHSFSDVEYPAKGERGTYIFLDDTVASGNTVAYVTRKLRAECVGLYLYRSRASPIDIEWKSYVNFHISNELRLPSM